MAAQKTFEGAQGSSNNVIKSKRKRFQDSDDTEESTFDCHSKELLAKELSDYFDRTIEEVEICDKDDKNDYILREDQTDDFKLFSISQQRKAETLNKKKHNCFRKDSKTTCHRHSSSSEDDDEMKLRLKEAAVSVQDIFGPQFGQIGSKTVELT